MSLTTVPGQMISSNPIFNGVAETQGNIGSNISNSFGGPYPVMMICAKNGTPNITFTVNYYQNGAAWEPMHYRLDVTSTQGSLTGNQTAWWLINMTHYNGSTVASISASGGTTSGYALSYGNSGSGFSQLITNTITITPNGSQNYSTAMLQVVNYGGVGSIT